MSLQSRKPTGRLINPTFFVFCEGETEEQYIKFLRSKYRLPIEIDPKVAGHSITESYINNYKKLRINHPKDKTYLVYDLDTPGILDRLAGIRKAILLSSNPCFELWYLLHYQDYRSYITSSVCSSKLLSHHANYRKAVLDRKLKDKLNEKQAKAILRASKLTKFENPSTQVYQIIIDLEGILKA